MLKRPASPSNIPAPVHKDGSNSSRTSPRTPRKLPQTCVPVPKTKIPLSETKIPTPVPARKQSSSTEPDANGELRDETQKSGVVYMTENLIRKMAKEDDLRKIFKLVIMVPKDLNKKIKYIENLDPLANLQILSIAHNMIEKMERMDKLMNLQILDLSDNLLRKIEGIENLHQLTILNLEDNQIENIPVFIGKKLKCLRTFKIARNQLKSLHELYKLRSLPDLVKLTVADNPVCTLQHHRELSIFLLRSLESLDGFNVTEVERENADQRFQQEEIRYLEVELEKVEKRLLQSEAEREKAEQYVQMLEQNDINLKKDKKLLKQEVSGLQQDVDAKDSLLERKTNELSKACEKQYKLEQELAFYKLDTKFDEFWKFSGYEGEQDEGEYIDEDQSAYIGKARFKPNSMAKEKILPSKAQMINLIKIVRRKDGDANEINQKIVRDLEEALNVDLEEKQNAIAEAEEKLERLKSGFEGRKMMGGDANDQQDTVDAPQGIAGIEEREKIRQTIIGLIQEAKELQATVDELKDKMIEAEKLLEERDSEVNSLRERIDEISDNNPDYDKLIYEAAAKEEQCHQLEEYMEQLTSLLAETENDLAEKTDTIRALEMKLKMGEPVVQKEMKHGLEDVVKKLTQHLEDLKSQMIRQKEVNSDLAKERDFLLRKVEQLEDDAVQRGVGENELVNLRNQLLDKENALRDEMEINDKLRGAYEKISEKLNKKKRHVGTGSRNVWFDPEVESLKSQVQSSRDESERLRKELERLSKQREAERKALEERLEHGQAKLDQAVQAARDAGDYKREAKELDRQLQRLQAEKAALKQRINSLENDLDKEKDESVPWRSLLQELKSLINELNSGDIDRRSPVSAGASNKEKKLQRVFEDLRNKIKDDIERNEEESEAKQREIEKFQAKIEKLHGDLTAAQSELSEANLYARELEQEAQDHKQHLEQTQSRLKKALNDRSNNERLIEDEFSALQGRLDESERAVGMAKKETNKLKSKLEEADRKMRAVEQLAKEAELDFETAKAEVAELKRQLTKATNDKISQGKRYEDEIDELKRDLDRQLKQGDDEVETLKGKLKSAERRMKDSEHKANQFQQEASLDKSRIQSLENELDSLQKQQRKAKADYKNELVGTREKFERLQKGFEQDIEGLKNQIKENEKYINHLKDQIKRGKRDFQAEIDGLAEEISELQAEVLNKESQFHLAEENNSRLLENISRLEDENNALNDHANAVEKEATEMLKNERALHAKELQNLEDEVDNLKRLMKQLQQNYSNQAYERERNAINSLSHEIDNLRRRVADTEREAEGREMHHLSFKKRLSDEIERLRQTVDDKEYESRLLDTKNKALHQRMADEIDNALSQISNLKRTLGYREQELASLRNSTEPLIAEYRGKISNLLNQLQAKEDELTRLQIKLNETLNGSHYVTVSDPRFEHLLHEVEVLKSSIANLQTNATAVLSSPLQRLSARPTPQLYTPLRASALELNSNSLPQSNGYQTPVSTVHHHHYGAEKGIPVENVLATTTAPNGSLHIHHLKDDLNKSKKKKRSQKKTDTYDDEYCNIAEHEDLSDHVNALESRLRDSSLSRSKISSVESALTRRARIKQLNRSGYKHV
eukprot:gene10644-19386_t